MCGTEILARVSGASTAAALHCPCCYCNTCLHVCLPQLVEVVNEFLLG